MGKKKFKVYAERVESLFLVVEAESLEEANAIADEDDWNEATTIDGLGWRQLNDETEEMKTQSTDIH